jgi:carboxypeptidase Q
MNDASLWRGRRLAFATASLALALGTPLFAQAGAPLSDRVDLDAVYRIKQEGLQRSHVMEIESYLTDVYGPRLTNSPNIKAAAQWTTQQLKAWGLANVHLEPWGPFGRGWSNERFSAQMIAPRPMPLIAYPGAWTPGTGNGPVTADAMMAVIDSEQDFAAYKGKLKGKFVLAEPAPEVEPHWDAAARRWTDQQLQELAMQPNPTERRRFFRANRELNLRRMQFYAAEGVAAVLYPGRGDDGTVFGTANGPRDPAATPYPPTITLAAEHYGRIARLLAMTVPVTLQIDDENRFYDDDVNSFNVIAEIPGTDKADEVVMLGGHFDSWHWGTGATDNAAGSAVMLEAVRILKATGLKLRRTVRLALWTGEEQGLLGSRAYVKQHFGDPETMQLKPEQAKLAGYFNVDNGTGRIRGVYLQGNEAVAPIFEQWMQPFRNLGMSTLTIRNTGGTDHLSFDAVGIPGFQFIQDAIDYGTRTHHSNMDLYERVQPFDMMENAVIVATFVYQTANRNDELPRTPLPPPQGSRAAGSP